MNKYQAVENVVYKHYKRKPFEITKRERRELYSTPRHITWYFLFKIAGIGCSQQSKHYLYNHATIINAVKRIQGWSDTDTSFKATLKIIEDSVRKELGLEVKLPLAKLATRKTLLINIYNCKLCKALIYTNKDKGYCTDCGANLKFEV